MKWMVLLLTLFYGATVDARGPRKEEALLVTTVSAMVVVDIVLAVDEHQNNTFSEIIRGWSASTLAVPWVAGVVAGHLFHPFDYERPTLMWEALTLAGLSAAVAVASGALKGDKPRWAQALAFAGGAVSGAALWRF